MLYPSIDKLLDIIDSKYTLVSAAAKRARQLQDGANPSLPEPRNGKFVGIALEEILEGKIDVVIPKGQRVK